MKFASVLSTAILASSALAQDVACLVNGESVATVDLDTGVCPFQIPSADPVEFDFVSWEDYACTAYYAALSDTKYWTDIRNAGRIISIPAKLLFGVPPIDFFKVHADKTPAANSTAAIRRRLLKQVEVVRRDDVDDFVAYIETLDGTALPGTNTFAVVEIEASSSAGAGSGTETVTDESTTVVTITSCSNNACSETVVPATNVLTTVTINGEVTSYTTVCPLTEAGVETETDTVTTVVTITSCENNACHETVVPAVETLTTVTVNGEVTSYTTVCPLTEAGVDTTSTEYVTSYVTITSCGPNGCKEESMVETVTTVTINGVETEYTTYCPVTATETGEAGTPVTTAVPTTEAAEETPAITVAPYSNSTNASIVCTGDSCDTTTTIQSTVIISVSGASASVEADVSTFEAAAPAIKVGGVVSLVALVFGSVWLL